MKKIGIIALMVVLFASGCGKVDVSKVKEDFESQVAKTKSYLLKGNMEIINNEDTYVYPIEASFLKDDFYKVKLVNQTNNHEQIILKNKEGVYVITPSLNKSFKFQSEWPNNSSQSYLLGSLLSDVKNDSNGTLEETDKNYILKAGVNYPNNSELAYEKIYFDKSMNLERVEVFSQDDTLKIKVTVKSLDLKANLSENDFALEELIDQDCCSTNTCEDKNACDNEDNKETTDKTTKKTSIVDQIIYPLYIPSETYLTSKDVVETTDGDRVILTYSGNKSFVLVEEPASLSPEFEVIPVYGDPTMLNDTVAALQSNSVYWTSNNIEYYLAGDNLSSEELLSIATSLTNIDIVTSAEAEK